MYMNVVFLIFLLVSLIQPKVGKINSNITWIDNFAEGFFLLEFRHALYFVFSDEVQQKSIRGKFYVADSFHLKGLLSYTIYSFAKK